MHHRNPYASLSWRSLSSEEDLAPFFDGARYSFSRPGALAALTRALLRRDFSLEWRPPADRLCPPVPGRLNYLLWAEDLPARLALGRLAACAVPPPPPPPLPALSLDVGVGANAIFPLLGARLGGFCSQWLATDIDAVAVAGARAAATRAGLPPSALAVLSVEPGGPLLAGALPAAAAAGGAPLVAVTVCNPPFFASWEEAVESMRRAPARAGACGGAPHEMATVGGEAAFAGRLADESQPLGERALWFSCMLGKRASVADVSLRLARARVPALRTTELVQGVTRRWAVAWSWAFDAGCALADDIRIVCDLRGDGRVVAIGADPVNDGGGGSSGGGDDDGCGSDGGGSVAPAAAVGSKRRRIEFGRAPAPAAAAGAAAPLGPHARPFCIAVRAAAAAATALPPHVTALAGGKTYGAAFSAKDAAHLLQCALATAAAAPAAAAAPFAGDLADLIARIASAVATPRTPAVAVDDAGLRAEARRVDDVILLPPFLETGAADKSAWRCGGALAPACLAVFRGLAVRPAAGGGGGSAEGAAADAPCFTFEVQVWQLRAPADDGGAPAALLVVPAMLAAWQEPPRRRGADVASAGDGALGCGANRARFDRWAERLRADVGQTSRRWRRAAAGTQSGV